MLATLVHLLHFLVGLLGLVLLYAALFLHETEEGQVQNRLEKLWIDIDDLSKAALSRQTAFLQRVSAMANSALNKLFGARLFSTGAVSASLCFSLGSLTLLVLGLGPLLGTGTDSDSYLRLTTLAVGLVSFMIGLLPIPFRYLGFPWIFAFLLWAFYSDLKTRQGRDPHYQHPDWLQHFLITESLGFFALFVGGFLCDVFFIAVSRWCLRKSSELNSGWKIASLVTLNGCAGLTLISPVILGISHQLHFDSDYKFILLLLGFSNGISGAISLLFVVLALAALIHLLVWPLLKRPLYSLQRFGVARNPKLLAATSATCLLFAWPHSPVIQAITKLIHGG